VQLHQQAENYQSPEPAALYQKCREVGHGSRLGNFLQ
jgi:hypothetical protein